MSQGRQDLGRDVGRPVRKQSWELTGGVRGTGSHPKARLAPGAPLSAGDLAVRAQARAEPGPESRVSALCSGRRQSLDKRLVGRTD